MAHLPSLFDELNRPLGSWRPLLRQLDEMFNNVMGDVPLTTKNERAFTPACDVEEASDRYLVTLEIPGLDKADINVELQGNQLFVSGERSWERAEHKGSFERRHGRFERVLTLPDDAQRDAITADYKDGLLCIEVPRTKEAPRARIPIGAAPAKAAAASDKPQQKLAQEQGQSRPQEQEQEQEQEQPMKSDPKAKAAAKVNQSFEPMH